MNDNFSDLMEVGYDVLAHHGIKGQRWGKQNGPPYPLNSEGREKFKKQVKKFKEAAKKKLNKKIESDKKYRIIEKQKRAEKRRRKILNDPKKLYKHKDEFTTDEIYDAIDKLRSVNQLVDEAGLDQKPAKKQKEVKLSKKQKRMSDSYASLLANYDKFSPEELELAKKRAGERSWLGDKTQEKVLNRLEIIPNLADKGARTLYGVSQGVGSVKKLKDDLTVSGLKSGESHALWLGQQKDEKTGRSLAEMLGEAYTAQRGESYNYLNEETRKTRYEQAKADAKTEKEQRRQDELSKWSYEKNYQKYKDDLDRQDRDARKQKEYAWDVYKWTKDKEYQKYKDDLDRQDRDARKQKEYAWDVYKWTKDKEYQKYKDDLSRHERETNKQRERQDSTAKWQAEQAYRKHKDDLDRQERQNKKQMELDYQKYKDDLYDQRKAAETKQNRRDKRAEKKQRDSWMKDTEDILLNRASNLASAMPKKSDYSDINQYYADKRMFDDEMQNTLNELERIKRTRNYK